VADLTPHPFDDITPAALAAAGHMKWTEMGPDVLGAWVAEMDFGTAPAVTAALHDAVDRQLFGYLPGTERRALSAAAAAWQADQHGWAVDPDDVHPMPDVLQALEVAARWMSEPGRPIILPVPAYMPFLSVPDLLDRELLTVELVRDGDRFVYDLDALDAAFAAGGQLLVLVNPHNPTGRVLEREELVAISEVVERHDGRVLADEIHGSLVHPGHRHVPYASVSEVAARHALTATSASKAFNLPGLKCAQIILSNDADRAAWERFGWYVTEATSTLGVVASTAAYRHGGPWLAEVLTYLDSNRSLLVELLAEHLPEAVGVPPEGTYLAWVDLRALDPPEALADRLLADAGVAVVDGARCGEPGRGHIRLNLATPRPVLRQVVAKIGEALRGGRP
jgi:cystathionine beta-lyase